jgi:hypothetical protein
VLLFFSHGYPNEMVSCFRARDIRDWDISFPPVILINCACYNGAPGRWYEAGRNGRFEDRGFVAAEDSVALALLDAGLAGYFAGIAPWHGPLANQVFYYVTDDGMRLGAAAKAMADRLALAFLPERIAYPPTRKARFTGEGTAHRRRNGAAMILYGDPKLAPYAGTARRLLSAELTGNNGTLRLRLRCRPLITGWPGADMVLPQARLMDYYSVQTNSVADELRMEIYRVLPMPKGSKAPPRFRVVSGRSGSEQLKTGTPQAVVEETPWGRYLHVRVPIDERVFPPMKLLSLATQGFEIELVAQE